MCAGQGISVVTHKTVQWVPLSHSVIISYFFFFHLGLKGTLMTAPRGIQQWAMARSTDTTPTLTKSGPG